MLQKLIAASLLCLCPALLFAQLSIYAGYGFHTPSRQVAGDFVVYDMGHLQRHYMLPEERRLELLVSMPVNDKGLALQSGLARMGINYEDAYPTIRDGIGETMSLLYYHEIVQWQLPIRLEQTLYRRPSLRLATFGGIAFGYNRFDINRNSSGRSGRSDGSNIYEVSDYERTQRAIATLGELGLRAELKLHKNLWLSVNGLYQQGFYKFHEAAFDYSYRNEVTGESQETSFSLFSRGTNLSANFGLRYVLGKKDQKPE